MNGRSAHDHTEGTSLIETALVLPILIVLCLYAVDFGYYFLVAGNLVTASRNAALYSSQGFSTPSQQQIPSAGTAGSLADTAGTAGVAGGDLSGLANVSTRAQVEVCSKSLGVTSVKSGSTVTGYITNCSTFPSGSLSHTPDTDPESLYGLLLHRVEVVYTINMPVSLNLFTFNLTPPATFRWQVERRAID